MGYTGVLCLPEQETYWLTTACMNQWLWVQRDPVHVISMLNFSGLCFNIFFLPFTTPPQVKYPKPAYQINVLSMTAAQAFTSLIGTLVIAFQDTFSFPNPP